MTPVQNYVKWLKRVSTRISVTSLEEVHLRQIQTLFNKKDFYDKGHYKIFSVPYLGNHNYIASVDKVK